MLALARIGKEESFTVKHNTLNCVRAVVDQTAEQMLETDLLVEAYNFGSPSSCSHSPGKVCGQTHTANNTLDWKQSRS